MIGLERRPTHPYVRLFLRLRGCGRGASVGEQVGEALIISQIQKRCKVQNAGPHPLIPPAPYRVWVRSETAIYLRPRQTGLLLEPQQALREVVGEDVGSSAVVCALSRHSAGPSVGLSDPHLRDRPVRAAGRNAMAGGARCRRLSRSRAGRVPVRAGR